MVKRKDMAIKQCLEHLCKREAVDITMKHFGEECQISTAT